TERRNRDRKSKIQLGLVSDGLGPTARDEVLTDLEDRLHPYSLPPGAASGRARERLVDDANRLLPRSFAAAVEATARPFVQGISDYEQRSSRRIALVEMRHSWCDRIRGWELRRLRQTRLRCESTSHRRRSATHSGVTGKNEYKRAQPSPQCASHVSPLVVVETANLGEADELACRP
ncbi:MAG TPA: hypothetical protein VNZ53_28630, partial [Steroidobacteraceae bacterium]|nr:hypothetical protein [Steroidobacteraceae bacterium]